jgi:hypothetical protein
VRRDRSLDSRSSRMTALEAVVDHIDVICAGRG